MTGLLKKDYFLLKSNLKTYIIVVLFYIILGFVSDNASMIASMLIMLFAMQAITTLSWDDNAKWEPYALTMPVSRHLLVLAKYIFSFLLVITGVILSTISSLVSCLLSHTAYSLSDFILPLVFACIYSVFMAILLPIIFKLGVEKARTVMYIIFIVPFLLIVGGAALFERFFSDNSAITDMLLRCGKQLAPFMPVIIPVVLLAAIIISYRAAINIIDKKDF